MIDGRGEGGGKGWKRDAGVQKDKKERVRGV